MTFHVKILLDILSSPMYTIDMKKKKTTTLKELQDKIISLMVNDFGLYEPFWNDGLLIIGFPTLTDLDEFLESTKAMKEEHPEDRNHLADLLFENMDIHAFGEYDEENDEDVLLVSLALDEKLSERFLELITLFSKRIQEDNANMDKNELIQ